MKKTVFSTLCLLLSASLGFSAVTEAKAPPVPVEIKPNIKTGKRYVYEMTSVDIKKRDHQSQLHEKLETKIGFTTEVSETKGGYKKLNIQYGEPSLKANAFGNGIEVPFGDDIEAKMLESRISKFPDYLGGEKFSAILGEGDKVEQVSRETDRDTTADAETAKRMKPLFRDEHITYLIYFDGSLGTVRESEMLIKFVTSIKNANHGTRTSVPVEQQLKISLKAVADLNE